MPTTMVLDAPEMARWSRGNTLPGSTCHFGARSQFTSVRYGERLPEIRALPSIGSVGDNFNNALAEPVNGESWCEETSRGHVNPRVEPLRPCGRHSPQIGTAQSQRVEAAGSIGWPGE